MDCPGDNVTEDALLAFGTADANKFICSEKLRPGQPEQVLSFLTLLSFSLQCLDAVRWATGKCSDPQYPASEIFKDSPLETFERAVHYLP